MKQATSLALLEVFMNDLNNAQARAVCNDFDLARIVPDRAERQAIMRRAHELNGDPEVFEEENSQTLFGREYRIVHDGLVLLVLHEHLKSILGAKAKDAATNEEIEAVRSTAMEATLADSPTAHSAAKRFEYLMTPTMALKILNRVC